MAAILTLTLNPVLDVSTEVDEVRPNEKLRCDPPLYAPGGGGINVSRAIARLGGESIALYTEGGDVGRTLRHLLEDEDLEARGIEIQEDTNEGFAVTETSSGDQFRFHMPGPTLRSEEWSACLEALEERSPHPDFIVVSGSLPPGVPDDFHARAAEIAQRLGAKLVVDTSREPLRRAVAAGVYLVKPNFRELGTLAGRALADAGDAERAAQEVLENAPVEVLLASLGRDGVLLATGEGCERIEPPQVEVRSRIGAGDSTVAGMVLALQRGWSLNEAARFAVAAGSAAVMTQGTELCRREDAERLYRELGGTQPTSG